MAFLPFASSFSMLNGLGAHREGHHPTRAPDSQGANKRSTEAGHPDEFRRASIRVAATVQRIASGRIRAVRTACMGAMKRGTHARQTDCADSRVKIENEWATSRKFRRETPP